MAAPSFWRYTMPTEVVRGGPYHLDHPVAQVVAGLTDAAMLALGVVALAQGSAVAVPLLWIGLAGPALLAPLVWERFSPRARAADLETRDGATVAPCYRSTVPLAGAFLALTATALVALLGLGLLRGWTAWTWLLLVPLAVFLAHLASAATGRLARGGLELSPAGLTQHGWSFTSTVDWDRVAMVTPVSGPSFLVLPADSADVRVTEHTTWWRFDRPERSAGRTLIRLDGRRFRFDVALLHDLVAHHAEHPVERAALGTAAAVERARLLELRAEVGPGAH